MQPETTTHVDPATMARMLNRAGLYNLSANSLQLLCALAARQSECLNMTDAARHLGISTAAITGTVDALEVKHFVIRQHRQSDRRVILIHLTHTGARALDDILNA